MIIDAHAHLGSDVVFDDEQDEGDLIETYKRFNIGGAIVQPFICRPYIEETMLIHNRLNQFCRANPNQFWGMISINPHFKPDEYEKEANRCVKEFGFVGIKISTIAHATNPSSKDGFHVFEVARQLKVPIMIHTGIGVPFADPMSAWEVVKAFPDVKTILAHAGSNLMVTQAVLISKTFENVYLEPSWLPAPHITHIIKTLGSSKVMFSSDICSNLPVELEKYRNVIKKASDYERVMAGTVIEVYDLKMI